MKKSLKSILPVAIGLLIGSMCMYFVSLYVLTTMTYKKEARNIAGQDYVSEVTRWPGHTKVINIPVYYG